MQIDGEKKSEKSSSMQIDGEKKMKRAHQRMLKKICCKKVIENFLDLRYFLLYEIVLQIFSHHCFIF